MMHFSSALPILLAVAVLVAGCLLLAWYIRVMRPLSAQRSRVATDNGGASWAPPLARGFLRGGRFRGGTRDELRGQLYRLSAEATRAGDEEAAQFIDQAALALAKGGAVVSCGSLVSVGGKPSAAGGATTPAGKPGPMTREFARADADGEPVYPDATLAALAKRGDLAAGAELTRRQSIAPDLRQVDRLELDRRSRLAPESSFTPGGLLRSGVRESPVFRDGVMVGWLRGHETTSASVSFHEGVTVRKERGAWTTDAPDHLLVSLSPSAFRMAIFALFLALGLFAAPAAHAAGRTYHLEALAWVAAEPPGSAGVPTHLKVEGEVAYVAREADGDVHVRVCHNGRCMVAECIPGLPVSRVATVRGHAVSLELLTKDGCRAFRIGQRIAVWGISRFDGAPGHGEEAEAAAGRRGHWEIHPVEGLEVLP